MNRQFNHNYMFKSLLVVSNKQTKTKKTISVFRMSGFIAFKIYNLFKHLADFTIPSEACVVYTIKHKNSFFFLNNLYFFFLDFLLFFILKNFNFDKN